MSNTFLLCWARAAAILTVNDVFPTPPLPLLIQMIIGLFILIGVLYQKTEKLGPFFHGNLTGVFCPDS